jgi:hypothetical protein
MKFNSQSVRSLRPPRATDIDLAEDGVYFPVELPADMIWPELPIDYSFLCIECGRLPEYINMYFAAKLDRLTKVLIGPLLY